MLLIDLTYALGIVVSRMNRMSFLDFSARSELCTMSRGRKLSYAHSPFRS